ncbi:MAG: DNA methyltransferase, partial [Aggregatilineales bacterium]
MTLQEQLTAFIAWWQANITGDEKSEAQIFTDKLMQAFGHEGAIEAGGSYEYRIKQPRNNKDTTTYADYVLPRVILLEMKKRGENLADHYRQIEDYWKALTDARPRYALLCNFDEIWIYDFNIQFYDPVDRVAITELIERKDALEFLVKGSNKTPVFQNNLIEVTKEAAFRLSQVFQSLEKHDDVDNETAQRYVLQCMLAMYAEDSDLLPSPMFTRVVEDCMAGNDNSYDLITAMFTMMNMPGKKAAGRFYGMDYFNGGIFKRIYPIALSKIELKQLRDATRENWSKVKPAIFGAVFEDSLTEDARHKIGAHFTSEQDIKRVIDPVIVDPWLIAIDAAETVDDLLALHKKLCEYIVLDPACGSGNFLYIAYIEVKSLEAQLLAKLIEKGGKLPKKRRVTVKQFYGYDINEFAVELAKVTLMIAKQEAVLRTHSDESALPLDNMDDNILCV